MILMEFLKFELMCKGRSKLVLPSLLERKLYVFKIFDMKNEELEELNLAFFCNIKFICYIQCFLMSGDEICC